eukprot:Partr_v1_DN26095_c0_g1_i14_m577 putative transmembrane protein 50A
MPGILLFAKLVYLPARVLCNVETKMRLSYGCQAKHIKNMKRNVVISYSSGALFAIGWWFLFDASVMSNFYDIADGKVTGLHYLPGISSTLALILINLLPASAFDFSDISDITTRQRLAIFIGFLLAFGGVFAATWMMIAAYLVNVPIVTSIKLLTSGIDAQLFIKWPGIAVFLQNILIFTSTIAMRFGRRFET